MGIGGHLMWTPVIRELHKKHGKLIHLKNEDGKKEVWKNNPYISLIFTPKTYNIHLNDISYAVNSNKTTVVSEFINYDGHIINYYLEELELPKLEVLKCELFFDEDEIKTVEQLKVGLEADYVVIEPHSKLSYTPNRQYSLAKWQTVVNEISKYIQVVQISMHEPALDNTIKFIGTTNFRESVLLIEDAKVFISSEGGLVHGATCVDTPSVVPINSYIPQQLVKYPQNTYLSSSSHSPCGSYKECQRCLKEMNSITPESIIEAVKEILNK